MHHLRIFCSLFLLFSIISTITSVALNEPQEKKMKDVIVTPTIIDFKLIKVGKAGAQVVNIANKGTVVVTIKSAKKIKTPYSIEPAGFPKTIAPGKSLDVKLIFKRTKVEEYKGQISLIPNEKGELIIRERGK